MIAGGQRARERASAAPGNVPEKYSTPQGSHMIAGSKRTVCSRRPRNSARKIFDPEGVAPSMLRCDPFRVGFFYLCLTRGGALTR